jgi:putative drug exporter of the RND superfamily
MTVLRSLAGFSVRRRWLVIAVWVLLVIGIGMANRSAGGSFTNDLSLAGTDSQKAYDTLRTRFPQLSGDGMQVVLHDDHRVDTAEVREAVDDAIAEVRAIPDVATATSPYGPGEQVVSDDARTAVAVVQFDQRVKDIPPRAVEEVQAAFEDVGDSGVQVEFGGAAMATESGPSGSEIIGLGAAVLVLLVAFGSLFAMLVPLLTALFALAIGMGVIHLLAGTISIGTAGPVVAAMIGLGVGIDYALLVVTRHREGLFLGHSVEESVRVALSTAGRSVLVAGTTVIIAILSLYAVGIPFVSTLGLASAITVAATLLAAVTLLPALLGVFGTHLDRLRVRPLSFDHGGGRISGWHRWTRGIQARPWPFLVVSALLLAVMALPLFSLRLGSADGGSAAKDSTESRAYHLVADAFGPGRTGPLLVTASYDTADAETTAASAGQLVTTISSLPGVAQVGPPKLNPTGDTALLTVVPTGSPDDESTEELVHRLRDVLPDAADGADVHVGGSTATAIDLADRLGQRMGWFMAFVVGLSFLLLLTEFRSPFVAVKAAIMNLLSVGAAYGAVVAVFQWGWLGGLFGAEPGPIESFAPMMLFAVLFGLSMDYEVFLLSRVREEYLRTGDAGASVADGIAATARVITAAASVMVVVFASFLLNDQRVVNMFGFGLAVAIAVDATIVRLVLVPSVMAVAGRFAWWSPAWLDRVLPHVHLEPGELDPFERELDGQSRASTDGEGPGAQPAPLRTPAHRGTDER